MLLNDVDRRIVMNHHLIFAAILGLLLSPLAQANRPAAPGRHGPPPEAIEACASASEGDNCSFTGREGETLQGTCETARDEQLVCAPENAPDRI